jgi:hypothetical protein
VKYEKEYHLQTAVYLSLVHESPHGHVAGRAGTERNVLWPSDGNTDVVPGHGRRRDEGIQGNLMNTLRAIFEAIKALFVWWEKVAPTWDQSRQSKISELKSREAYWNGELAAAQLLRDDHIHNMRPCPDGVRDRIAKCVKEIGHCRDEIRALGGQ